MKKRMLPLGSVIEDKKGEKYTIIGYLPVANKDDKYYMKQYLCCEYDMGIIKGKPLYSFNDDEINNIFFIGYKNVALNKYQEVLSSFYESVTSKKDITKAMNETLKKYLNNDQEKIDRVIEKTKAVVLKGDTDNDK